MRPTETVFGYQNGTWNGLLAGLLFPFRFMGVLIERDVELTRLDAALVSVLDNSMPVHLATSEGLAKRATAIPTIG